MIGAGVVGGAVVVVGGTVVVVGGGVVVGRGVVVGGAVVVGAVNKNEKQYYIVSDRFVHGAVLRIAMVVRVAVFDYTSF